MCPNPGAPCAPGFSLTFPPDPAWVRTCRETVRTSTTARSELTDLAVLLTSESVSNAITASADSGCRHPISLFGEWVPDGSFRVHVRDGAPGVPVVQQPALTDVHGRGMYLVANWASRWGVCIDGPGPGKSFWFQLGCG
ncbi:MAG: ATP-binding protein [Streptomyces sp.]|uniref:ATP-binding protein n=1 Tax=Streptomyces sp. TaxID=1931 RepID=UPI003D6AEBA6